jgi:hypothetical protein
MTGPPTSGNRITEHPDGHLEACDPPRAQIWRSDDGGETWAPAPVEIAAPGWIPWRTNRCRTYWGSHGCVRDRGHRGRHRCDCTPRWAAIVPWRIRLRTWGWVGLYPYYGPGTELWGEDA